MNKTEPLDENILIKIPKDKFIVAYTGTKGIANALKHLIETGKLLKDYNNILILIVGEGGEKENLKNLAKDCEYIKFLPSIPKRQVHSLLKLVDVCYIGCKNKNLYKYGVSQNKIFDYMFAEKPIIHSINTKNDIISKANCGITVEAENPSAIADAILKLYNMPEEEKDRLGKNGLEYVKKHHDISILAKRLINIIEKGEVNE